MDTFARFFFIIFFMVDLLAFCFPSAVVHVMFLWKSHLLVPVLGVISVTQWTNGQLHRCVLPTVSYASLEESEVICG